VRAGVLFLDSSREPIREVGAHVPLGACELRAKRIREGSAPRFPESFPEIAAKSGERGLGTTDAEFPENAIRDEPKLDRALDRRKGPRHARQREQAIELGPPLEKGTQVFRVTARARREPLELVAKGGDLLGTEPKPTQSVEKRDGVRSAGEEVVEDPIKARTIRGPLDDDGRERLGERPAVLEPDGAHGAKRVEGLGGRNPEAATTQTPKELVE
jgi:hypothetical protein